LWLHIQYLVDDVSVLASVDPTNSIKSISDVGAPIVQIELTILIRIINRKDLQFNL
jgi:hypothetical protein